MPSQLTRRLCSLCGLVLTNKRKLFEATTISEHLNTCDCKVVRKNIFFDGNIIKCQECNFSLPRTKFAVTDFLTHLAEHDAKLVCIYCDKMVNLRTWFGHLKEHSMSNPSLPCKRCHSKYKSVTEFYSHLIRVHGISHPNYLTMSNHLSDNINNRQLSLMGVLLAKYDE